VRLVSTFLINLPVVEQTNAWRLMYHLQLAYWYWIDHVTHEVETPQGFSKFVTWIYGLDSGGAQAKVGRLYGFFCTQTPRLCLSAFFATIDIKQWHCLIS
jgi:hypothetical protein